VCVPYVCLSVDVDNCREQTGVSANCDYQCHVRDPVVTPE